VQLYAIWYASRFGSFDAEGTCAVAEAYFRDTFGGPRMSFGAAAQQYGMRELRERYPDMREGMLEALLSWPLELPRRLIDDLSPPRTALKTA
jgi:hypothetical protein